MHLDKLPTKKNIYLVLVAQREENFLLIEWITTKKMVKLHNSSGVYMCIKAIKRKEHPRTRIWGITESKIAKKYRKSHYCDWCFKKLSQEQPLWVEYVIQTISFQISQVRIVLSIKKVTLQVDVAKMRFIFPPDLSQELQLSYWEKKDTRIFHFPFPEEWVFIEARFQISEVERLGAYFFPTPRAEALPLVKWVENFYGLIALDPTFYREEATYWEMWAKEIRVYHWNPESHS